MDAKKTAEALIRMYDLGYEHGHEIGIKDAEIKNLEQEVCELCGSSPMSAKCNNADCDRQ